MILLVRQCLRRRYDDGVTGVDTDRIEVFHITYRDGRIVGVTDDFVFDLLIALDTLLYKYLMYRRKREGVLHHGAKFFRIVGKTAAGAAERKGRT